MSETLTHTPRPRTDPEAQKSISTLLRELFDELRALLRDEVRLAKTETSEMLTAITRNAVLVALGAAVGLAAVLVLASAIDRGLTSLFAQFMDLEVAVWLAPLVLTLVLALVAFALIKKGLDAIKRQSLVPERTVRTVKEDKQWMQEKFS